MFDENKYYLSQRICRRGHDWNNTGKSLMYKSSRSCTECRSLTANGLAQTSKGKASLKAAQERFAKSKKRQDYEETWRTSDVGKLSQHERYLRYRETANGKEARKRSENKYATTEGRRLSLRRKHARRRAQIRENYQTYTT